jgi:hypothetical protein
MIEYNLEFTLESTDGLAVEQFFDAVQALKNQGKNLDYSEIMGIARSLGRKGTFDIGRTRIINGPSLVKIFLDIERDTAFTADDVKTVPRRVEIAFNVIFMRLLPDSKAKFTMGSYGTVPGSERIEQFPTSDIPKLEKGGRRTRRFRFPRRMTKKYCKKTPCKRMGFTQKASCRPYKNCYLNK